MSNNDTYINFIRNKEAQRKDKDNIFCTGISDTEFVKFAIKYLLGDDWYVVDPLGYSQITQLALEDILFKYSKQFKKEYKKAKEDKMRATKINEYSKNKKTSKSKNPYKRVISNIRNYGCEYVSNKKQVQKLLNY